MSAPHPSRVLPVRTPALAPHLSRLTAHAPGGHWPDIVDLAFSDKSIQMSKMDAYVKVVGQAVSRGKSRVAPKYNVVAESHFAPLNAQSLGAVRR